jgi:hypothetical protein
LTPEEQIRHYLIQTATEATVRCFQEQAKAATEKPYRCPWWLRWFPPLRRWWDRREKIRCNERIQLHLKAAHLYAAAASMAFTKKWVMK